MFRHMNIGSGKVDVSSRGQVKHHLIDIMDPSQSFTPGEYYDETCRALQVMVI